MTLLRGTFRRACSFSRDGFWLVELGNELPWSNRPIALVDPLAQHVEWWFVLPAEIDGHPAALAKAISGRLSEWQFQRQGPRAGQLDGKRELVFMTAEDQKDFVADLVGSVSPGEILPRLGKTEGEAPQEGFLPGRFAIRRVGLAGCHESNSV